MLVVMTVLVAKAMLVMMISLMETVGFVVMDMYVMMVESVVVVIASLVVMVMLPWL